MQLSLPIVLLLFAASLLITMSAAAWFTRRLEAVGDALNLSPSLLSLLGALGANIPNYVASIVAPLVGWLHAPPMALSLLFFVVLVTLGLFGGLALHALRRGHAEGDGRDEADAVHIDMTTKGYVVRWIGEGLLALVIALGGVVVMVQSGQALTADLHMPEVLAGLLVLAVATSLPNTVVAYGLARTDREVACVEEIFSSNSINAALGIALPLLFWRDVLHDRTLLLLDGPLMVALTLGALLCVLRRRVSRTTGVVLLLVYAAWVVVHVLV